MAIRLNLLAEQQYAEELRRRDPVKRSFWVAGFVVALMLLYSLNLWLQSWTAGEQSRRLDNQWRSLETNNIQVLTNQFKTREIQQKLDVLHQLATNRFLWGTALNTLQDAAVDTIQITRMTTRQTYVATAEEKPKAPNLKGKPATAIERIKMIIEAKDYGPPSGEKIEEFKKNLRSHEYFKPFLTNENSIRLTARAEFAGDLTNRARPFVQFTLECELPERIR